MTLARKLMTRARQVKRTMFLMMLTGEKGEKKNHYLQIFIIKYSVISFLDG